MPIMFVLKSLGAKLSSRRRINDGNSSDSDKSASSSSQTTITTSTPSSTTTTTATTKRSRLERCTAVTVLATAGAGEIVAAVSTQVAARANTAACAILTRSRSFHGTTMTTTATMTRADRRPRQQQQQQQQQHRDQDLDQNRDDDRRRGENVEERRTEAINSGDDNRDDNNVALSVAEGINAIDLSSDADDRQKNEASQEEGAAAAASAEAAGVAAAAASSSLTNASNACTSGSARRFCSCPNCHNMVQLIECAVCFECLQGGQIRCCPVCANSVCRGCAGRLAHCAFCRSGRALERNRALERFVDRLVLPCRNARRGCALECTGETRRAHEATCEHAHIECPVSRNKCTWHGPVGAVPEHLDSVHKLRVMKERAFALEIGKFRAKVRQESRGCIYTICLSCHDQMFAIRIVLKQMQLRLSFQRLGWTRKLGDVESVKQLPRFGIAVQARVATKITERDRETGAGQTSSHKCRKAKVLVAVGSYERDVREVAIDCRELLRSYGVDRLGPDEIRDADDLPEAPSDCPCGAGMGHDIVKIEMKVKSLEAEDGNEQKPAATVLVDPRRS